MQGIDELHLYALLPAAGCFAVRSDWKASQSEESLYGR